MRVVVPRTSVISVVLTALLAASIALTPPGCGPEPEDPRLLELLRGLVKLRKAIKGALSEPICKQAREKNGPNSVEHVQGNSKGECIRACVTKPSRVFPGRADMINCNIKVRPLWLYYINLPYSTSPQEPRLSKFCLLKSRGRNQIKPLKVSNKFYYTALRSKLTWYEARRWCRQRGANLPSSEAKQHVKELLGVIKSEGFESEELEVWLGASDLVRTGGTLVWEDEGQPLSPDLSKTIRNTPTEDNTCLSLFRQTNGSSALRSGSCSERRGVLCDMPRECYAEQCFPPPNNKNLRIGKLCTVAECSSKSCRPGIGGVAVVEFDKKGYMKVEPERAYTTHACGKQLYFSTTERHFMGSRKACCQLGLRLVDFPTQESVECFSKLFNLETINYAIWTSGTDVACNGEWAWCGNGSITKMDSKVPWLAGEPHYSYDSESCAALYMGPRFLGLASTHCTRPLAFVCEAPPAKDYQLNVTGPLPRPQLVNFTNSWFYKRRKLSEYNALVITVMARIKTSCNEGYWCNQTDDGMLENRKFDKNGNFMVDPKVQGSLVQGCGNYYFFSTEKININWAWATCCSIGMNVLHLQSPEELRCLMEIYKDENREKSVFVTSFYDPFLIRSFFSCDGLYEPTDAFFTLPGEPNNEDAQDPCLGIHLAPNNVGGLLDIRCPGVHYFACKAQTKPRDMDVWYEQYLKFKDSIDPAKNNRKVVLPTSPPPRTSPSVIRKKTTSSSSSSSSITATGPAGKDSEQDKQDYL